MSNPHVIAQEVANYLGARYGEIEADVAKLAAVVTALDANISTTEAQLLYLRQEREARQVDLEAATAIRDALGGALSQEQALINAVGDVLDGTSSTPVDFG